MWLAYIYISDLTAQKIKSFVKKEKSLFIVFVQNLPGQKKIALPCPVLSSGCPALSCTFFWLPCRANQGRAKKRFSSTGQDRARQGIRAALP